MSILPNRRAWTPRVHAVLVCRRLALDSEAQCGPWACRGEPPPQAWMCLVLLKLELKWKADPSKDINLEHMWIVPSGPKRESAAIAFSIRAKIYAHSKMSNRCDRRLEVLGILICWMHFEVKHLQSLGFEGVALRNLASFLVAVMVSLCCVPCTD